MPLPPPNDWPQLSAALFYDDAAAAIDWLVAAFGFEVRLRVEGESGEIEHSELLYGGALVMVSAARRQPSRVSPRSNGGLVTQSLMLYVDDVDAHHARARAHGATVLVEPKDSDYGDEYWADRSYEVADCEGHRWWICQRLRGSAVR